MVELCAVTFCYGGRDAVLRRLSVRFEPGSVTAVTGPSGCGKSTMLYLCGLLLRPSAGEVMVAGRSTSGLDDAQRSALRSRSIGFVFQDAVLDPSRSVLDNLVESAIYRSGRRRADEDRAEELLERFSVRLDSRRRPGQLSGGQAQRVALCRALLGRPSLILADEPTGNLDAVSTAVVVDALRDEAAAGATVVIASHDDHVVSCADRVHELA